MATVHVEFDVEVPDDAIVDEIDEWLRYSLGDCGGMKAGNPFEGTDVKPVPSSFMWRSFR